MLNTSLGSKGFYNNSFTINHDINTHESIVELLIEKVLGFEKAILECEESDMENTDDLAEYEVDLVLHSIVYHRTQVYYAETTYKTNFPNPCNLPVEGYYLQLFQPPKSHNVS